MNNNNNKISYCNIVPIGVRRKKQWYDSRVMRIIHLIYNKILLRVIQTDYPPLTLQPIHQ